MKGIVDTSDSNLLFQSTCLYSSCLLLLEQPLSYEVQLHFPREQARDAFPACDGCDHIAEQSLTPLPAKPSSVQRSLFNSSARRLYDNALPCCRMCMAVWHSEVLGLAAGKIQEQTSLCHTFALPWNTRSLGSGIHSVILEFCKQRVTGSCFLCVSTLMLS